MVSQDFGVFFCAKCSSLYTKRVARNNNKWSPFLEHPRVVAAVHYAHYCMFAHPYHDTAGEACGPLVAMSDMKAIMQGQTAADDILRQRDEADINAKYADEIVKVFDKTQQAAKNRKFEKYDKKREATRPRLLKKWKKIHSIVEKLKSLLGEVPWKGAVLDYEAEDNFQQCVRFSNPIVDGLLVDVVKMPSKATKTKLQQLSESLLDIFRIVGETNFHDFSFLCNSDPLESILLEYYSHFRNSQHLYLLCEEHLDLLREGKCLESLEATLSTSFHLDQHICLNFFLFSFGMLVARKIVSSLGAGEVGRELPTWNWGTAAWMEE